MSFFYNHQQQPHGSINQVIYSDKLPSIREDMKNKRSGALIGAEALDELFLEYGWDRSVRSDEDLSVYLRTKVIYEMAERFSTMLYVLHYGEQYEVERENWTQSEWSYWNNVRRVIIGGGFIKGFGDIFIPRVNDRLESYYDVPIKLIKHEVPEEIVLFGLESHCPKRGKHLLMDFGGTAIKYRTLQESVAGSIMKMPTEIIDARPFSESIVKAIKNITHEKIDTLHISVASYLKGNIPISSLGLYGEMKDEVGDFVIYLEKELDMKGRIMLYHDATVAADPYRHMKNTVVITVGTALGCGYIE